MTKEMQELIDRDLNAALESGDAKLKLYAVLSAANLWDALKSWLSAQTYEGINAWTAFSLAQELTEDHPMFAKWFSAAKTALGVDDATAEELLAKCVKEGY